MAPLTLLDPPTGKPLALGGGVKSAAFAADVALVEGTNVIVVRAAGADGNDAQRILTVHRVSAPVVTAPAKPAAPKAKPKPD